MTNPKQIPFDWDEYERTKRPVFTRNGQAVTQLTKFEIKAVYPIMGVVDGTMNSWNLYGRCNHYSNVDRPLDLVFHSRTETRSVWVNVYPSGVGDCPHKDRYTANLCTAPDRIDCIELTYEVEVP